MTCIPVSKIEFEMNNFCKSRMNNEPFEFETGEVV